jgi:arylformamidase
MIHDVTIPISAGLPVWDGDPPTIVEQAASMSHGHAYNLSRIDISVHVGTHVDAPRHFSPDGAGIDAVPLDALIGVCFVWAPPGNGSITAAMLCEIPSHAERLLIKTGVGQWWEGAPPALPETWRALNAEAADLLARRKIRLIGTDAPSVDAAGAEEYPAHRLLLSNSVVVIESLDLSRIEPGSYDLICLPLRLTDADGAPARVVLVKEA